LYSDEFSFGFPLPSLPPAHWLPLGAAHACLDARAIDEAWRDLRLPTTGAAAGALAATTTAGAAAAAHALTSALGLEWQEYDSESSHHFYENILAWHDARLLERNMLD
jgi:hypothetical protein